MPDSFSVDPDGHAAAKAGEVEYHKDAEGNPVVADKPKEEAADDKETLELNVAVNKAEGDDTPADEDDDDEDKPKGDGEDDDEDKPKDDEAAEEAKAKELLGYQEQLQGWTDEFRADGKLSEESSKTALETIFAPGLPIEVKEALLEAFQVGITSTQQLSTLAGWNLAGGKEPYEAMSKWAETNLSNEEKVAFNTDATGGDSGRASAAIKGLHARYQQALGVTPTGDNNEPDLSHDGEKAEGAPAIQSRQELARIVGSKEYKTDPAFRAKVDRQIEASLRSKNYRVS